MKPVRLFGDPFATCGASSALRSVLEWCDERGFRPSLCLSPIQPSLGQGDGTIVLGDDAPRPLEDSAISPKLRALIETAAHTALPSTAPVVVFAPQRWRQDMVALAGLEWPKACAVLVGGVDSPEATLTRVEGELRWAGTEDPAICSDLDQLEAWADLPSPPANGPVLHVGSDDPSAGTDVAIRAFFAACNDSQRTLRIVLPKDSAVAAARFASLVNETFGTTALQRVEFVLADLAPEHAADCAAALLPLRRLFAGESLAQLLASGRPVVATRYHATAPALAAPSVCVPVGGAITMGQDGLPWCEPDLKNVIAALKHALSDAEKAKVIGQRARAHALAELSADRPAAPPKRMQKPRTRPVVALEAPFFEVSSSSELSIDTARALARRGNVELKLVPSGSFRHGLDALRERAPGLESLLSRDPGDVDLWLSTGWPPRVDRPSCRTFASRIDWEYGALPTDLSPLVISEADAVVVHSRHVERTVADAGCSADRIVRIPHGVDGAVFCEDGPADAELVAWKGDLPMVLFVGGMVFRKGFDVLVRMALEATRRGAKFALCLKAVGHDQHYAGYHMEDLAKRLASIPGAPPVRILDADVSREKLASIYRAADLLVHPYRGEGFGLPVLEARACGVPVLVTSGGATDDFAFGRGCVGIPSTRRAIELGGAHMGEPWLLEPDGEAASALLAQCIQQLQQLKAAAREEAPAVRAAHTWEAAAEAIERLALGEQSTARRVSKKTTLSAL